MEYKVLSGPFNVGQLERDLNRHAAQGWRVVGTFQAISWMKSRARGSFSLSCWPCLPNDRPVVVRRLRCSFARYAPGLCRA